MTKKSNYQIKNYKEENNGTHIPWLAFLSIYYYFKNVIYLMSLFYACPPFKLSSVGAHIVVQALILFSFKYSTTAHRLQWAFLNQSMIKRIVKVTQMKYQYFFIQISDTILNFIEGRQLKLVGRGLAVGRKVVLSDRPVFSYIVDTTGSQPAQPKSQVINN